MMQKKRVGARVATSIVPILVSVASCTGGPGPGGWFAASGLGVSPAEEVDSGLLASQDGSFPVGNGDSSTGPTVVKVSGRVANDLGTPVANASLSISGHVVATTDSTGAYSFTGGALPGPLGVTTSSTLSLAPALTIIPVKAGVTQYAVPITMVRLQTQALSATSTTTMTVPMLGQSVSITIPAGSAPAGSMIRVAPYSPSTSLPPGVMAPSGDPTSGLRSAGMFYYDIVDGTGAQLGAPPSGIKVTIPGSTMTMIPASQPFNQWQMAPDGTWMNPVVTAQPAPATPVVLSPTQFGYWNSDHAYKTACVTGTLTAGGASCGGARVQALGVDNLSSFDSSGADGSFCVTGAQTRTSNLLIGTATRTVTMPAAAGDCTVPTSCEDIGAIVVPADQCQAAEQQAEAGSSSACGAGTWAVTLPGTPSCGSCTSYTPNAMVTLTVSAAIAQSGGSFTDSGGDSWVFNVGSCSATNAELGTGNCSTASSNWTVSFASSTCSISELSCDTGSSCMTCTGRPCTVVKK